MPTAIVENAIAFNQLAPNMIVKVPVTRAGISAIEEITYLGVSVNATVCFTVSQSIVSRKPLSEDCIVVRRRART